MRRFINEHPFTTAVILTALTIVFAAVGSAYIIEVML